MIREITKNDLDSLLELYMQLHDNSMPEKSPEILRIWEDYARTLVLEEGILCREDIYYFDREKLKKL